MRKIDLDIPSLNTALAFSKGVTEIEPEIKKNIDEAIDLTQNIEVDLNDFLYVTSSIKENVNFFSTISQVIGEIIADGCICEEELLNVLKEYGVDTFTGVLYSFMKNGFIDGKNLYDSKLVDTIISSALADETIKMNDVTGYILPNMLENDALSYEDFAKLIDVMYQNKTLQNENVGEILESLKNSKLNQSEELNNLMWQLESISNSSSNMKGARMNKLGLVYYSQNDPKWEKINYHKYNDATIGTSACGFTSVAMIVAAKEHDTSITPQTIMRDSDRWNSEEKVFEKDVPACSWDEMAEIAAKHGIETNLITSDENYSAKINYIFESVSDGKPVVVLKTGHYYAVCPGMEEGQVIIMDPFKPNEARNGIYTEAEAERIIRMDSVRGVMSFSWDSDTN